MNEEFIGMWKDREDMRDSTAWVRNLRGQWVKPKFDLEEMVAKLPKDYTGAEESFGPPVGKEEW